VVSAVARTAIRTDCSLSPPAGGTPRRILEMTLAGLVEMFDDRATALADTRTLQGDSH